MAIDYGEKRVGLASTDETGKFALPREVLSNNEVLVEKIVRLASDWDIDRVIIGESKNFQGEDNKIMIGAREFSEKLKNEGLKVIFHPELLTSAEAKQLQGENEMLDASAAALILKSYIDTHDHD